MRGRVSAAVLLLLAVGVAGARQEEDLGGWAKQLSGKDVEKRRVAAMILNRAGKLAAPHVKELAAAAEDEDDTVCAHAVQALGKVGPKAAPAIPTVVKVLVTRPRLRKVVYGTLRSMGKPAIGPLVKSLNDEQPQVRALVATALGMIGFEAGSAGPDLAKRLTDDSFRVRRAAADALQIIHPRPADVLPALVKAVQSDNDPDVCASSAIALGRLGKPALPAVATALASKNPDQRYFGCLAAREMRTEAAPAVKALVGLLRDEDPEIAGQAAFALGGIGEPAAAPLTEALTSKQANVRRLAILSLGQVGKPAKAAAREIVKALDDPDKTVSVSAAQALGLIGDRSALEPLLKLLKEGTPEQRQASAQALGELGAPKEAIHPLVEAMKSPNQGLRQAATMALIRIGKPAVPALVEVTKEKETDLRIFGVVALGAIGPSAADAVDRLAESLKDANAEVRLYSSRALGRIGPGAKAALKALKTATGDSDPRVRAAAKEAMSQISIERGDP